MTNPFSNSVRLTVVLLGVGIAFSSALAEDYSAQDWTVSSESTAFETMVLQRRALERDPASFLPSARVIAVRRELGLTEELTAGAPIDIVLNSGTEKGIEIGSVLDVVRRIPIQDPYRDNQQKDVEIKFASVRIVFANKEIAIARVNTILAADKTPWVGHRAVMVGDYIGRTDD